MASIDSLTVLSTDGASDVVKTATRTVTEASATVKGLTGIDIPQLLSDALGTGSTTPPAEPTKPKRGPSGGGGSGGRLVARRLRRLRRGSGRRRPSRPERHRRRRRDRVGDRVVGRHGIGSLDRLRPRATRRTDADARGAPRPRHGDHGVRGRARQCPAGTGPRRPHVGAAAAAARVRRPAFRPPASRAGRGRCGRPRRVLDAQRIRGPARRGAAPRAGDRALRGDPAADLDTAARGRCAPSGGRPATSSRDATAT